MKKTGEIRFGGTESGGKESNDDQNDDFKVMNHMLEADKMRWKVEAAWMLYFLFPHKTQNVR